MKVNSGNNVDIKIFLFLYGLTAKNKTLQKIVLFLEKKAPMAVMFVYYSLLVYLLLSCNIKVILYTAIPFATLGAVTVLRNILNKPRPFDELDIKPIAEHSSGYSFPSRHASSAFIIAMAILYINKPLGFVTLIMAIIVCLTRIFSGIHYPSDVAVGAFIGLITGYIIYFL